MFVIVLNRLFIGIYAKVGLCLFMHVDQHGRPGVGYVLGEIDTSVIAIFARVVLGDGG
ncbi:MAG: hypothetical protein WBD31_30450 [Rubripirellula sp.]